MNKKAVQAVITESAALVDASIELEKHAASLEQKVAAITAQASVSAAEVARLNKQASDFAAKVREGAEKVADHLASRGFNINKSAFVDRLVTNPLEVFGVIEKVANEAVAPQLGAGDTGTNSGAGMDPIERFATQ